MSYVIKQRPCCRRRAGCCRGGCQESCQSNGQRPCGSPRGSAFLTPDFLRDWRCRCPRNVIYDGPCPPDPACGCPMPLPPPPPDPPCYPPVPCGQVYGFFAQNGSLVVQNAGGPLPLDSIARATPGSFRGAGGILRVEAGGMYMASFAISLPQAAAVNAQLSLLLDGETVSGTIVNLMKGAGAPGSGHWQTVFAAEPGQTLQIVSSAPLSLTAADPRDTLASLTLNRLEE